jgi:hypothetical protein
MQTRHLEANRDQAFRREARPGRLAGRKSLGEARQAGTREKGRTGRKAARYEARQEGRRRRDHVVRPKMPCSCQARRQAEGRPGRQQGRGEVRRAGAWRSDVTRAK